MKRLYISVLLAMTSLLSTINAIAQTETGWVSAITHSGLDYVLDQQGNSYLFGNFSTATVTFGNSVLTNTGSVSTRDFFVVKYDAAGRVLWAKSGGTQFDEYISKIIVDELGNVFAIGYTVGYLILGSTTLTSPGIFLFKMNQAGDYVWAKGSNDGPGFPNTASTIVLDNQNNIIVSGKFYASTMVFANYQFAPITPGYNSFVAKLDPNGNVLWGSIASGDDTYGTTVDNSGNIYTVITDNEAGLYVGSFSNQIITPYPANYNIYILKYNSAGSFVWGKTIGGNRDDYAFNIITDPNQNFYITGFFNSDSIRFDSYNLIRNDPTHNMFLTKYNSSGDAQWVKTAVGRAGGSVLLNKNESIYVGGTFGGTSLTINPTTLINHGSISNDDIFLIKYDTTGNFKWLRGEGSIRSDYPSSIALTTDGYLLLGGNFGPPSITLGSITLNHPAANGFQPFVAKLDEVQYPEITNIVSSFCHSSADRKGKLLNPPATYFTVTIKVDGIPVAFNPADSSFTYFSNTVIAPGVHTLSVKYERGSLSTQINIKFTVITSAAPNITISTNGQPFCTGGNITFTSSGTSLGDTPFYQWQVNNTNVGTNSASFNSSAILNNDQVKLTVTSSLTCASPAIVSSNIITLNMGTPPIANAGNDTLICAGSSVTLNGSGGNLYSWTPANSLSNPSIANPVATPSVSTIYILRCTNATGCSAYDTVKITVAVIGASPSVSITTPSALSCIGDTIIFSSVVNNAGSNPTYQWKLNDINVGSNSASFSSSTLTNNNQVKLSVTNNSDCVVANTAISNTVVVQINELAIPILVTDSITLRVNNPDVDALYTWQIKSNGTWDNIIPLATRITYIASVSGEYRVNAAKGACNKFSESQITSRQNLGNSGNKYGINIYPNPVANFLIVDSLNPIYGWEILELTNTQGSKIIKSLNITSQPKVTLNISYLKSGIYYITFRRKNGEPASLRFLKK